MSHTVVWYILVNRQIPYGSFHHMAVLNRRRDFLMIVPLFLVPHDGQVLYDCDVRCRPDESGE